MMTRLPIIAVLVLVVGSCSKDLDEGNDLNEMQKFLRGLEGTWIGTADSADTVSGNERIVFEMILPADGKPSLDGLTGFVWFGDELDTSPLDPDDPGVPMTGTRRLREGYRFDLLDMAIVNNRLLAGIHGDSQWKEFCEAQTEIYPEDAGSSGIVYHCVPDGSYSSDEADENCIVWLHNGEQWPYKCSKIEICLNTCDCDIQKCTIDESDGISHEFDVNVDIENGMMLGTGGTLGRIEAVKQ